MDFIYCIECAGYGFHRGEMGFITCSTCKGNATRPAGYDWEPHERRRITDSYKGCAKVGYVWHFACAGCGAQFQDGIQFGDLKKRGLIPCCKKPKYVMHSPHATICDCAERRKKK